MSKKVILFVEGKTEEEFYKNLVIPYLRKKTLNNRLSCTLDIVNVRGFGGFKNDVLMKFKKFRKQFPKDNIVVYLCYDTDVFEFATTPYINWDKIESLLYKYNADKVIHIRTKMSIEDWLLYDLTSICKWLRIKEPNKLIGTTGYDKIKRLFNIGNKVYLKGEKIIGLLDHINIETILNHINDDILPLINEIIEK